jgi:uncharacterized RDD family membrane protein YckC
METSQENLLTDLENNLVRAETGKRFLNYLIDLVSFYVVVFLLSIIIAIINPNFIQIFENTNSVIDRLVTLLLFGIYMGIVETITKGRSLGKLITGTKAVNHDGSNISASTAFARGLSRAVPFEVFSAFGSPPNPWHDRWNNTYVIDLKASTFFTNQ